MATLLAQYNQVPRFRNLTSNTIIRSDGGTNLVDTEHVPIANLRGQLIVKIMASDDPTNVYASFNIFGGFGEFPSDSTQNWQFVAGSEVNCTVEIPVQNQFLVSTVIPGGLDREYDFIFKPVKSAPGSVQQTSANSIGANDLTINLQKTIVIQGF